MIKFLKALFAKIKAFFVKEEVVAVQAVDAKVIPLEAKAAEVVAEVKKDA